MFSHLTDEQEAIRDAVRDFAQQEIAPHADRIVQRSCPRRLGREADGQLRSWGLVGRGFPRRANLS